MSWRVVLIALFGVFGGDAAAQVDTLGMPTAPWAGQGPVRATSPWWVNQRGWAASLGIRYSSAPLIAYVEGDGAPRAIPLIGGGVDLGLGGVFGLHDRVALGATLPVRLGAGGREGGPALGDLGLWMPVTVLARGPAALAVVPRIGLPTGGAYASAQGIRVGAELSAGTRIGVLGLVGTAGTERAPAGLLPGGWLALGGAAVDAKFGDWTLGVEGRARGLVGGGRGLGTEAVAVARWTPGRALLAAGGGGAPLGAEPGVAPATGFAVVGARSRPPAAVLGPTDRALRVIAVRDPAGAPVRGAELRDGDRVIATTDAAGQVRLGSRRAMVVRAPGLADAVLPRGEGPHELVLPWRPTPLEVRITDAVGEPVEAQITVREAGEGAGEGPDPQPEVWSHGWRVELAPGAYVVRVEAEGFGPQERAVEVAPRRAEPMRTELVLMPASGGAGRLDLAVRDPEARPVEGARVLLDGAPLGTTASGGALVVEGLRGVNGVVQVTSENYREGKPVEVKLGAHAEVSLAYQPGTVRVLARGPDGAVTDGLVQITGPVALPALPLGSDGERLVVLEPGDWTVLLSSAALGVQERSVEVRADSPVPLLAEFVLRPEAVGGDLLVRVLDPEGAGVNGAEVSIDGEPLGRTASGGALRLRGVSEGARVVEITHPGVEPVTREVAVGAQLTEAVVPVRWRADTVFVAATDGVYDPVDAMVQFDGDGEVPPGSLGPPGRRYFGGVPAGDWELVLSSPEHGIQTRRVQVGGDALATAVVVFRGETGGTHRLEIRVEDPEGRPSGAPVWLDDQPVGRADGGRLVIEGLTGGIRQVAACDEALARTQRGVRVSGHSSVTLRCGWAEGATRIEVTAGGEPVPDAWVRLGGAFPVRPAALGPDGQRVFALAPGPWTVLVSSPAHGIVERTVQVGSGGLTELAIEVGAAEAGFLVRVARPDGVPVAGAEVRLGGRAVGRTNAAGVLALPDPPSRRVQLAVSAPDHLPAQLRIPAGHAEQLVELPLAPVPVKVTVVGQDGERQTARVSASGPAPFAPVQVEGDATIALQPGRWQVLAEAEGLGTRRLEIELAPGETGRGITFGLVPARVARDGESLRVQDVQFELGEDVFGPEFRALLEEVAAMCLADDRILRLEAQGHTDATGSVAYNMELSARRAESVRAALIELGVPPTRVVSRGFGPTRPLAPNDTEAGRSQNRRVEFRVVETNARAD